MKTIDLEIRFKGTVIPISYKLDDNFESYFIRQFGVADAGLDDNKLLTKMHAMVTGTMHFILDNIQLPSNPVIIDIGSGNSLIDLALSKHLGPGPEFILIDGDGDGDNINSSIHSREFLTYNSWQMVNDAIQLSGLDSSAFSMHGIDYVFDKPADLIISTNSWGLHYPIDVYLDKVVRALKPGGHLVIFPVINLNGYKESVSARLDNLLIEPDGDWMRSSTEWPRWKAYFPNVSDDLELVHKCIWQKPVA